MEHSVLYEPLKRLFQEGEATETTLTNAVTKGALTEAEKEDIMNQTN